MMINSAMIGGVAPVLTPIEHQSLINVNTCEVLIMIDKKHSTKIFLFASVLRSDPTSRPVMWRVKAPSEKDARRKLSRDYILSFAGVIHHRDHFGDIVFQ